MLKSLGLLILGSLILMLVMYRLIMKDKHKYSKNIYVISESGKWTNSLCFCGLERNKWKVIAVDRFSHRFLLVCPQCQANWEEELTASGKSRWRPVDEQHARYHYSIGSDEEDRMN